MSTCWDPAAKRCEWGKGWPLRKEPVRGLGTGDGGGRTCWAWRCCRCSCWARACWTSGGVVPGVYQRGAGVWPPLRGILLSRDPRRGGRRPDHRPPRHGAITPPPDPEDRGDHVPENGGDSAPPMEFRQNGWAMLRGIHHAGGVFAFPIQPSAPVPPLGGPRPAAAAGCGTAAGPTPVAAAASSAGGPTAAAGRPPAGRGGHPPLPPPQPSPPLWTANGWPRDTTQPRLDPTEDPMGHRGDGSPPRPSSPATFGPAGWRPVSRAAGAWGGRGWRARAA